jgi:hypothetical protein
VQVQAVEETISSDCHLLWFEVKQRRLKKLWPADLIDG